MTNNFKELLEYSLNEYYECDSERYTEVLNEITDKLIDIAYENGWDIEVTNILDSFNNN